MNGEIMPGRSTAKVEDALREDLAQGDAVLASTRPVLRHLLAAGEQSVFSDEIIARVRGMLSHLARELLSAVAGDLGVADRGDFVEQHHANLARELLGDASLLTHAHCLVIEGQQADRLQRRSGIDPVLSPLLQELAASGDEAMAARAMHLLAAQARFMQQQRRMELRLAELPGDLFHKALLALRVQGCADESELAGTERRLRNEYEEGECRVAQIAALITAMGRQARRALELDHAGLAIFVTALGMASSQARDLAILSLGDNQLARLALSLRAAGLTQGAAEKQFVYLHPEFELPAGFDTLSADSAAAMLAASAQGVDN